MKPLRSLSILAALLSCSLLLTLSACTIDSEEGTNPLTAFSAKLLKSADAVDLEVRLKAELVRHYEREHERSAYWGRMYMNGAMEGTVTSADAGGAASGTDTQGSGAQPPNSSASGGTPDYSETNVQEKGVDEGDLVKTDGNFIYLARGTHFLILKASPADQTAIVSDIDLKESISELHVNGNKALVVTTPFWGYGEPVAMGAESKVAVMPSRPATRVHCYDITSKTTPTLNSSFDFPGTLRGSRRISNMVYLVTNYTVDIPSPVYPQYSGSYDQSAYEAASDKALEENIRQIFETPLDELLPTYTQVVSGVTSTKPAVGYTDVYFPEFGNGTDFAFVFSLNLGSSVPAVDSSAVLTSWGGIYMSPDSLYLTSDNHWQWIEPMFDASQPQGNPEPRTAVHKFLIDGSTGKPGYRASGVVDGWLNDRFSLSDYQGYLRIGTTRGGWWGEETSNQLSVLAEENTSLVSKGAITGLAKGERIYSMRYDGNRGYMVTFRQTDPLFTLDLSDPANPRVAGELKVDGFSTYIHLLSANRLLTIGRSADSTGRTTGNKLQLFNVNDLSTPTLLSSFELGEGWSDALHDPHAFLYYEPLGILTIPYYQYSYTVNTKSYSSGLSVFDIGEATITQRGIITAPTITTNYGNYDDTVDRSVIIGNGAAFNIYAVAHRSVTVAGAENLKVITTVTLPESYNYGYGYAVDGPVSGGTVVAPTTTSNSL